MNDLVALVLSSIDSFHPLALAGAFTLLFACSMLVVPWAVVQLPSDYFRQSVRSAALWCHYPPVLRLLLILAKNLGGLLLVLIGLTLLLLPGPGVITLVTGLLMLDVPGKFRFERWLLSHKFILKSANWLRIKRNKLPLQLD